ncbi:hypothetical protein B296_00046397 [Ensete ventricosum]|uniref:Uncharacterized protein n=1 Tax=Ensete ventricosum TaxID=4639 RepID=A0A426X016_ENSVE|nr:hypothetical protein B296_00046397 [Ensete ventricosum]
MSCLRRPLPLRSPNPSFLGVAIDPARVSLIPELFHFPPKNLHCFAASPSSSARVFSNLGTFSHLDLRPHHRSGNLVTCSLQPSSSSRCRSLPSKQSTHYSVSPFVFLPFPSPYNELKSFSGAGLLTFTEMPDVINSCQAVTQELLWSSPKRRSSRSLLPLFDSFVTSAEGYAPRSVGRSDLLLPLPTHIDLLLPPLTQIYFLPCHRSASSLDTDLLEGAVSCDYSAAWSDRMTPLRPAVCGSLQSPANYSLPCCFSFFSGA